MRLRCEHRLRCWCRSSVSRFICYKFDMHVHMHLSSLLAVAANLVHAGDATTNWYTSEGGGLNENMWLVQEIDCQVSITRGSPLGCTVSPHRKDSADTIVHIEHTTFSITITATATTDATQLRLRLGSYIDNGCDHAVIHYHHHHRHTLPPPHCAAGLAVPCCNYYTI